MLYKTYDFRWFGCVCTPWLCASVTIIDWSLSRETTCWGHQLWLESISLLHCAIRLRHTCSEVKVVATSWNRRTDRLRADIYTNLFLIIYKSVVRTGAQSHTTAYTHTQTYNKQTVQQQWLRLLSLSVNNRDCHFHSERINWARVWEGYDYPVSWIFDTLSNWVFVRRKRRWILVH